MTGRRGPVVVLASSSPRRQELIALLDLESSNRPTDLDEKAIAGDLPPAEAVVRLAHAKARAAAPMFPDGRLRIGADTLVAASDGEALGQPVDDAEAAGMLRRQSGTTVQVMTGIAVLWPNGGLRTELVTSEVDVRELSDAEVDAYVASGAPAGKAGGIEAQDRASGFVSDVRGCWTNVLGLPVCVLSVMLGIREDERPCPGADVGPCRLR